MKDNHTHERLFRGDASILRSPERIAILEVGRVIGLCTQNLTLKSVLDVGTGSGLFAEAFCGFGADVIGIDTNPDLLSIARAEAPDARFIEGMAESLPFDDEMFDLVFLGHLLHESDDPLSVLQEARRVVKDRVAVLEWPYRKEEHGPPLSHRIKPETVLDLANRAGYTGTKKVSLQHMDLYLLKP
jgi:ubiquinone/menaquinone biosynthesis C-methylase UbiE